MPSFRRSPVAPVLAWRSEPARSTRLSLPMRMCESPFDFPSNFSTHSIVSVKMECERDESAFIAVAPTTRWLCPTLWQSRAGIRVLRGRA
eukprot:352476-Chlamydomonas_euryale.AAC.1